jgi:hypothetical protein
METTCALAVKPNIAKAKKVNILFMTIDLVLSIVLQIVCLCILLMRQSNASVAGGEIIQQVGVNDSRLSV